VESQLDTLVMNLLVNAFEAIEQPGRRVIIRNAHEDQKVVLEIGMRATASQRAPSTSFLNRLYHEGYAAFVGPRCRLLSWKLSSTRTVRSVLRERAGQANRLHRRSARPAGDASRNDADSRNIAFSPREYYKNDDCRSAEIRVKQPTA
jgi:hypothetical protein